MSSLQEQLLKAGLTTKQKARQANTDKRKNNKQQRSGVAVSASMQEQVRQELAQAKAAKAEKDAALNAQKKQQQLAKEQFLRIQQLLQHHQVKAIDGDLAFNFSHDNKVKKLFVNDKTQTALVQGRLAICAQQQQIYVVTAETAEKINGLDGSVVLVLNEKVETQDIAEDDPYAAYQIPDDLMW
jgi:uncharacterized protein